MKQLESLLRYTFHYKKKNQNCIGHFAGKDNIEHFQAVFSYRCRSYFIACIVEKVGCNWGVNFWTKAHDITKIYTSLRYTMKMVSQGDKRIIKFFSWVTICHCSSILQYWSIATKRYRHISCHYGDQTVLFLLPTPYNSCKDAAW